MGCNCLTKPSETGRYKMIIWCMTINWLVLRRNKGSKKELECCGNCSGLNFFSLLLCSLNCTMAFAVFICLMSTNCSHRATHLCPKAMKVSNVQKFYQMVKGYSKRMCQEKYLYYRVATFQLVQNSLTFPWQFPDISPFFPDNLSYFSKLETRIVH